MTRFFILGFVFANLMLAPQRVEAEAFVVDPTVSKITFQIKHLSAYIQGRFHNFRAVAEIDQNYKLTRLEGQIDLTSVNTGNTQRDEDLQGPEFFATAQTPTAHFRSTAIDEETIKGELTIRGKTQDVQFRYTLIGPFPHETEKPSMSLHVEGTIYRRSFDINIHRTLDNGRVMLAPDVQIQADFKGLSSIGN